MDMEKSIDPQNKTNWYKKVSNLISETQDVIRFGGILTAAVLASCITFGAITIGLYSGLLPGLAVGAAVWGATELVIGKVKEIEKAYTLEQGDKNNSIAHENQLAVLPQKTLDPEFQKSGTELQGDNLYQEQYPHKPAFIKNIINNRENEAQNDDVSKRIFAKDKSSEVVDGTRSR